MSDKETTTELNEYEFQFSLRGKGDSPDSALAELMVLMKIDPAIMIESRSMGDILYRDLDEEDTEDEMSEEVEHEVICAMIDWSPNDPTLA